MKFKDFAIKTKEKLLNMLFPKKIKCIFCGRDIPDFDNTPYCDGCAKEEKYFNTGNRCMYCDMQIPEENIVCDFCEARHKAFEKTFCPLCYTGRVRSSILKLKSDNARYLAQPFARLIAARIKESDIKIDIVIPVPIHAKTKKRRGYNQSALLAKELAPMLGAEYLEDVVTKDKMTQNQKDLPYRDRLKNVENAFTLHDKSMVKNKNVLIVDDIMTTGSTLHEVALLLKPHAYHTYAAAIARDSFN